MKEIRAFLSRADRRHAEPGWLLGPLAVEMDTIVTTGLAGEWDTLSTERRTELMAWVRAQNTMRAWEQYQAEKSAK